MYINILGGLRGVPINPVGRCDRFSFMILQGKSGKRKGVRGD